jgi:hypothetical protein
MIAGIHLHEFMHLFEEGLKEYKKYNKSVTEDEFLKLFLNLLTDNF